MLLLLVAGACRPEAPSGYYAVCGGDTGVACADGLTCLALEYGDVCTIACAEDADCPLRGTGRSTRCTDSFCVEDEPSD